MPEEGDLGHEDLEEEEEREGYHWDGTTKNPKTFLWGTALRCVSTTMTPKMTPEKPMAHACMEGWPRVPATTARQTW